MWNSERGGRWFPDIPNGFVQTEVMFCPMWIQEGIQSGGEGTGCGAEVLSRQRGEQAGRRNRLGSGMQQWMPVLA